MRESNDTGDVVMSRPNFLIIGAQKAGSTWVYNVLRRHRRVFLPKKVELVHFNRPDCENAENVKQYLTNFSEATDAQDWIGEKTPGYFWSSRGGVFPNQPPPSHNPQIPQSVARVLGKDIRLILSLRHPVARAISAYGHHGVRGRITPRQHLTDVVARLGIGDIGLYDRHLAAWEEVFGAAAFTTLIFDLHSPSGVSFEVKIACIRALDKDFLPQAAPAVAQTAGSGRIRPRSRCFLAQGRRFSAQRTDLSSRFRSV